jgi:hypothetical protein
LGSLTATEALTPSSDWLFGNYPLRRPQLKMTALKVKESVSSKPKNAAATRNEHGELAFAAKKKCHVRLFKRIGQNRLPLMQP